MSTPITDLLKYIQELQTRYKSFLYGTIHKVTTSYDVEIVSGEQIILTVHTTMGPRSFHGKNMHEAVDMVYEWIEDMMTLHMTEEPATANKHGSTMGISTSSLMQDIVTHFEEQLPVMLEKGYEPPYSLISLMRLGRDVAN